MCRLFGMSAGHEPVQATFWLPGAPDSLAAQSHQNPVAKRRSGKAASSMTTDGVSSKAES